MQVSAISGESNLGYILAGNMPMRNYQNDIVNDTSFNSLTPYYTKRNNQQEDLPQVYDEINKWKNFCHKQILSGKLNVIA